MFPGTPWWREIRHGRYARWFPASRPGPSPNRESALMLIVHNFPAFPERWEAAAGRQGTSIYAGDQAAAFLKHRRNPDAVFVVNGDVGLAMQLAAKMFAGARRPLVAVDLVLREPENLAARLRLPLKKLPLSRAGCFIHYLRDLRGLT